MCAWNKVPRVLWCSECLKSTFESTQLQFLSPEIILTFSNVFFRHSEHTEAPPSSITFERKQTSVRLIFPRRTLCIFVP